MEKYIEMLEKGLYEELSNISFIGDLASVKYNDKYLIEYLLEKGIHSEKMDNYVQNQVRFAKYYLKYHILKPLLNCSLKVLLSKYQGELIIDLLLDHFDEDDKLQLYHNIKVHNYNDYHRLERDVLDIFLRHGVFLPRIFVTTNLAKDEEYSVSSADQKLLDEFNSLFQEDNPKVLAVITNEFKRCLNKNHHRTVSDIQKLISLKKKYPQLTISDSQNRQDAYHRNTKSLKTSITDSLTFQHEFSHLLYGELESEDESVLQQYEDIRQKVDQPETISKIKTYLSSLHQKYYLMMHKMERLYYRKIIDTYGNFDHYVEVVCQDILQNKPHIIEIWHQSEGYSANYLVDECNLTDLVIEFLTIEKEEFVKEETDKYCSAILMVENMLDALLMGKIYDNQLGMECLSGHGELFFIRQKSSLDECLANFDAIKKSDEGKDLIQELRSIVGDEIIDFLNNYIEKNRESGYGH